MEIIDQRDISGRFNNQETRMFLRFPPIQSSVNVQSWLKTCLLVNREDTMFYASYFIECDYSYTHYKAVQYV